MSYVSSFTSRHLIPEDGHVVCEEEEDIIKFVAAGLYVGGGDTVSSPSFLLLFLLTILTNHRLSQPSQLSF